MATTNPLELPFFVGENQYGIPFIRKNWSGGNNLSKGWVSKLWDTGSGVLHGSRYLPDTLDNGQTILMRALLAGPVAGAGGDGVRLEFAYRCTAASEGEDFSSWVQTVSQSVDVSSWAAKTQYRVDFTLTATNFAASDLMQYSLKRDHDHVDDDYAQILTVLKCVLVFDF